MRIPSALASALLAGCTRGEPSWAPPVVLQSATAIVIPPASAPTASAVAPIAISTLRLTSRSNGGAFFSTSAATVCAANEHVGPSSREDMTWAKRVIDLMGKGLDRKRLVCMFGDATGTNGDFIAIAPHHPSFREGSALGKYFDHPEESIEVTYVDAEMPQLASVERMFGPSTRSFNHHPGMPEVHLIHILNTNDRSLRAIATLADDKVHVAKLHLDVSDLRGWTPPPIRCWDGAHIDVYPPADRFAKGTWTIEAKDAASGARIASFTCDVPEDSIDRGRCTPPGEQPPGAVLGSMATTLDLHLPGQTPRIAITLSREGALIARREVKPRYETMPAANTPAGTCTSALDFITLRAPRGSHAGHLW